MRLHVETRGELTRRYTVDQRPWQVASKQEVATNVDKAARDYADPAVAACDRVVSRTRQRRGFVSRTRKRHRNCRCVRLTDSATVSNSPRVIRERLVATRAAPMTQCAALLIAAFVGMSMKKIGKLAALLRRRNTAVVAVDEKASFTLSNSGQERSQCCPNAVHRLPQPARSVKQLPKTKCVLPGNNHTVSASSMSPQ